VAPEDKKKGRLLPGRKIDKKGRRWKPSPFDDEMASTALAPERNASV
jgi:hypothetical protein